MEMMSKYIIDYIGILSQLPSAVFTVQIFICCSSYQASTDLPLLFSVNNFLYSQIIQQSNLKYYVVQKIY